MTIRPVSDIVGYAQVGMMPRIRPAKESFGRAVLHFRRKPINNRFVGKPDRLAPGQRYKLTVGPNVAGLVNPEDWESRLEAAFSEALNN